MPRPTLYEQLRRLRIRKGYSQQDLGDKWHKSQSWIALLEKGGLERDLERKYLTLLEDLPPSRKRTGGGEQKVGRLRDRVSRGESPQDVRGEPLDPAFDHVASLPPDSDWVMRAVSRTARDTEIGFLYDPIREVYGLVGFHRINGTIKRGRIISFEEQYDESASRALEAFAHDTFKETASMQEFSAFDDGVLADDEPVSH